MKQISLRLMFADVVLSHGTVRFVAAYAPHSGYSRDVLNKFYEDLHACLEDARGKRFQRVVGGDFNTQLNTGFRGTLLQDVVETFDLFSTCHMQFGPWLRPSCNDSFFGFRFPTEEGQETFPLCKEMETSTRSTRCGPHISCNFAGGTRREKTYHTKWS